MGDRLGGNWHQEWGSVCFLPMEQKMKLRQSVDDATHARLFAIIDAPSKMIGEAY